MVALALPRLGVGREVIGEWESLLYVGYILGFGWLTGLLQAYLVTIRTSRPSEVARYSRMAVLGVALFSALLLAVAAGLHHPLFSLLRLGDAPPGWWYFFLFLLTQWPGLFFEQVLIIRGKPWVLAIFGSFSALGFVLTLLVPIYYGADFAHALFVLAVFAGGKGGIVTAWLLYDRWKLAQTAIASNASSLHGRGAGGEGNTSKAGTTKPQNYRTTLLKTAWPLILYASVGALVTAFDPWFVNYWYAGDEAIFATFRYGARELPLLAAIVNGLMVTILPKLTESRAQGLKLLRDNSRQLYHLVFGGTIFLMLTSNWWWDIVFTSLFSDSLGLFKLYLFVVVSRLLFPMPIIVAEGETRNLSLFSIAELVSNAVLSVILCFFMGLSGVIIASVVADVLDKIILMIYLFKKRGIYPREYMDQRLFLLYCALLFASYFISF